MTENARLEALSAAKLAVRAYARNPSDRNASDVEAACMVLRRMDAVTVWRQRYVAPERPAAAAR